MTINAKFIFLIIPILVGFSHIYYKKYFKQKNSIIFLLIFFSISTTIYYQYNYNEKRRFMDLENVNIKNSINAKILDEKLDKLKWITILYPNNPEEEISRLNDAIKIINNETGSHS